MRIQIFTHSIPIDYFRTIIYRTVKEQFQFWFCKFFEEIFEIL